MHGAGYRAERGPHFLIASRQRSGCGRICGRDDAAEHRRLARSRRAGHDQRPSVSMLTVQPAGDRGQRLPPTAEPEPTLAISADPAAPGPPVPDPFRIAVQPPSPGRQRGLSGLAGCPLSQPTELFFGEIQVDLVQGDRLAVAMLVGGDYHSDDRPEIRRPDPAATEPRP